MRIIRKLFYYFYPTNQKYADTKEGDRLRMILGWCVFFHTVFFLVSLTVIGFKSMISEIVYGCWAYATYLTLREWQVVIYIFAMCINVIYGVFHLFIYAKINLLFYILNVVFIGLASYFTMMAYRQFRFSGGIHGGPHASMKEKLLEEGKNAKKKIKKELEKGLLEAEKFANLQGDVKITIGKP